MKVRVWTGKIWKIEAIMRGGPPQVKEVHARVIVGDQITVEESCGPDGMGGGRWMPLEKHKIDLGSVLCALVNAPLRDDRRF